MDVKGAFGHISRNCILRTIQRIEANGKLMRWTQSFMSNRSVGLVIDAYYCTAAEIVTRVPKDLLVTPILCVIYLSSIFREVEK